MSLEANKIAAAILVGGMLTLSSGLIANMIYGGHEGAEKAADHKGAQRELGHISPVDVAEPVDLGILRGRGSLLEHASS